MNSYSAPEQHSSLNMRFRSIRGIWPVQRILFLFAFAVSTLLAGLSGLFAQAIAQAPNLIFFMTDDQGYGDVGYMGHPHLKTPNLDEMAETGLRLDRFYAATPYCSPTRASVLTGRHPARMGSFLWGHALRPQEQTIAHALSDAGYRTGFFGKWHLGSVRAEGTTSPGAHGFDEWVAAPNFYTNDPWMSDYGRPVQLMGESSAVTVDTALDFIEAAVNEEVPFMVFIWTGSPHRPHEATDELLALYPGLPESEQHYYGEISGIDQALGHLRMRLRELGVAENTLLWFTSDNGGLSPEADMGGLSGKKGELWEGGVRVPAVLEWPGRIRAATSDIPTNTVDLYPTFLELAGIEPKDQSRPLDGISLVPLIYGNMDRRSKPFGFWYYRLNGQSMRSDEIVLDLQKYLDGKLDLEDLNEGILNGPDLDYGFIDSYPGWSAWIDGDWKLHERESKFELYNLADDPQEKNNIADRHRIRTERMKKALREWQDSVIHSLRGGDY